MIYVPDTFKDAATACKVINVGPDVNPIINVGDTVLCKTGFSGRLGNRIFGNEDFWCEEENIYGIFKNNVIFPLGNTVMIRRDIEDSYKNGIFIPSTRRTQSLTGEVLRFGFHRSKRKMCGLFPGMKIRLQEWQDWMIQLDLEDGSQGLIVRETDIIYCYEDPENKIQHQ